MAKIVVIDGLARSGTTLITSIIHSQNRASCYKGVFHEMLACNIGKWSHDYAVHPLIEKQVRFSDKAFGFFQKMHLLLRTSLAITVNDYELNYQSLIKNTLNRLERKTQYSQISKQQWMQLLSQPVKNFNDLDNLYQEIAKVDQSDILAFRWNQGLSYVNAWLRNPDHYWISVVRSPMDRALSAYKAFNQSYAQSVECTRAYADKLSQINHKHHYVIYFEDLIQNPDQEIKKMFAFLGRVDMEVNYDLKQQSGNPYKIETSDLVSEGKSHRSGIAHKGFDKNMLNKHIGNMTQSDIDMFSPIIGSFEVLNRYKHVQ